VPDADTPVRLALDLGGTSTRAALVRGGVVIERREVPTPAAEGPDAVVAACASLLEPWSVAGRTVCVAATGHVREGRVGAVNRDTLPG
jgi:N-acylmannosamine kinase